MCGCGEAGEFNRVEMSAYSRLSLSDFNPKFFDPSGPDLQVIINDYKEYRILMEKLDASEPIITAVSYHNHQRVVHYLLHSPLLDRLLITHVAGSGKTGTFSGYAQIAKHSWFDHLGDKLNQPLIRRTTILASGQAQVDDLKRMIVCTFSNGEYLPDKTEDMTMRSQKIRINNKLKKWYDISRYRVFASRIVNGAREEGITVIDYIRKHYAGHLIYVDEIQNLRVKTKELRQLLDRIYSPGYTGITLTNEDFVNETGYEDVSLEDDEDGDDENRGRGIKKIKAIEAILNVADYAPNVKLVIGSATVIVNGNSDYKTPGIMILKGRQLRYDLLNENLDEISEDRFNRYIVNRVSHVESTVGKWVEEQVGERRIYHLDGGVEVTATLYPNVMSPYQTDHYIPAYRSGGDIYTAAKQASIFVYPDGGYGTESFNKYMVKVGKTWRFGDELNGLFDMNNAARAKENLRMMSTTYYQICEMIGFIDVDSTQLTPQQLEQYGIEFTDDKGRSVGVIAIYNEYLTGPGIYLLGAILERFTGLEQFMEDQAVLTSATGGEYCTSSTSTISPSLRPKKRFAIIHSEPGQTILSNAKTILKSNENVNGEYIRVALLPPEAREGVSINNAVAYIEIGSAWNPADKYQSKRRVLRENSSDHLVKVINALNNPYLTDKYIKDGALIIRIYHMVGLPRLMENGMYTNMPDWNNSVDVAISTTSIRKDMTAARLRRFLKRGAIDCYVNKTRNTLPPSMNGTSECDYSDCNYGCYRPYTPGEVNMINYNNLFFDDSTDSIGRVIIDMFNNIDIPDMNIRDVIREVQLELGLEPDIVLPILQSIQGLIKRQDSFSNPFGYSTKLIVEGDRIYRSNGTANNTYYAHNLYAQQPGFSETLEQSRRSRRSEAIKFLYNMIGSINIDELINGPDFNINSIKDRGIEFLRQYGYTHLLGASNKYEEHPTVKTIRNTLYSREINIINIAESSLRTYFSPDYPNNRDYIMELILYVIRNHWVLTPYPDEAISHASQPQPTGRKGRRTQGAVAKKFKFPRDLEIFRTNNEDWIIHDLSAFKVGGSAKLTPFTNATGPFRTFKINSANDNWNEYSSTDNNLIPYHSYREAFFRKKTETIFDKSNNLRIGQYYYPLYVVVIGRYESPNDVKLMDTDRGNQPVTQSTQPLKPKGKGRPPGSAAKKSTFSNTFYIGGNDSASDNSIKTAYNVMRPYLEEEDRKTYPNAEIREISYDAFKARYMGVNIILILKDALLKSNISLFL